MLVGILTGFFQLAGTVLLTGTGQVATLHAAPPQATAADQPTEKKMEFRDGAASAVMAGKRAGGPLVATCFDKQKQLA